MPCKFHAFRDDLIRYIKIELQHLENYITFYQEEKSFQKIYIDRYSIYYPNQPQNNEILEILGKNLDAIIVTFWDTFIQADMSYVDFEYTIEQFINKQFKTILHDRYDFFCGCNGIELNQKQPICTGDGSCLIICPHVCTCDITGDNCDCHQGYFCPKKCVYACPPRNCKNYNFCNNQIPQWLYNINGGLCTLSCKYNLGPLKLLITDDQCTICEDVKQNIQIFCGHKLCFVCWKKITIEISRCPFCRRTVS